MISLDQQEMVIGCLLLNLLAEDFHVVHGLEKLPKLGPHISKLVTVHHRDLELFRDVHHGFDDGF